jgi:hypothetical protein
MAQLAANFTSVLQAGGLAGAVLSYLTPREAARTRATCKAAAAAVAETPFDWPLPCGEWPAVPDYVGDVDRAERRTWDGLPDGPEALAQFMRCAPAAKSVAFWARASFRKDTGVFSDTHSPALRGFRRVAMYDVDASRLTAEGAEHLRGADAVQLVAATALTEAFLGCLAGCRLLVLHANYPPSGATLRALRDVPDVALVPREVNVGDFDVPTDDDVAVLTGVRRLAVAADRLTGSFVAHLPHLEALSLVYTYGEMDTSPDTASLMAALTPDGAPQLRRLDVCHADELISSPTRKQLAELTQLEELAVSMNDGLSSLPPLPRLRKMTLTVCTELREDFLADVPQLEELAVYRCHELRGVSVFAHMHSLVSLDVEYCEGLTLQSFAGLAGLPRLQRLRIRSSEGVHVADVATVLGLTVRGADGWWLRGELPRHPPSAARDDAEEEEEEGDDDGGEDGESGDDENGDDVDGDDNEDGDENNDDEGGGGGDADDGPQAKRQRLQLPSGAGGAGAGAGAGVVS